MFDDVSMVTLNQQWEVIIENAKVYRTNIARLLYHEM